MNRDFRTAGKGGGALPDRLGERSGVFLGEMHDQRAGNAWDQVEQAGDAGAAIGYRPVDAGLSRRAAGGHAAAAKSEHAEFAGAFGTSAQRLHGGGQLGVEPVGPQDRIAFGGVKIGNLPTGGFGQQQQTRPMPGLGNGEVGAAAIAARIEADRRSGHGFLLCRCRSPIKRRGQA